MNYEAIGITTHDLQMGSLFLKELEHQATFPFLSATVVQRQNNNPIFTPHTTIIKNNLTIGIIGLTGHLVTDQNPDYKIIDWQQPLLKATQELSTVDLIIVLSNLDHQENLHIAKTFPQVNLILEAGQSLNTRQITLTDNTLIRHTPKEGKYIGELEINWQSSRIWQTNDRPILEIKNEIDRLQWFENRIKKRGGPEQAYKDNQPALAEFNRKMAYLKKLQAQLNIAEQKKANKQQASSHQTYLHPLKPSILDEPQTSQILKSSRKSTNTLRRQTDVLHHFDGYSGSKSCKKCHSSQYSKYEQTRHRSAYKTLVDKSNNNNPSCVFCHVTGLPERLAYVQAKIPQRLLEVGCEACHGPGKEHIKNPTGHPLKKTIPENTCLICHTDDHSEDFNYERDINFIH